MDWLQIALIAAAILGIAAGGALVARSPTFWFGLGVVMFNAGFPYLKAYVTKRMTAEQEAELRKTTRRAQEWDPFRKKPRDK